ncbi:MAG: hypothetical protein K6F53_08150 [Lachnospiraceae bacterium]|nr:hypothetical protein [Lachnospiraceae bacterium]
MDYTDIHSHILCGVDDGAPDLETSLRMLRCAYKDGIRRIILTPHFKEHRHSVGPESEERRIRELTDILKEEKIPVSLYGGHEILYFSEAAAYLEAGRILTLAGSRYVLVEFLPSADKGYIAAGLYDLLSSGYLPILAHAERYECLYEYPEFAKELAGMGIFLQCNAGSIAGKAGHEAKKFCFRLLSESLVSFAATDAHDAKRRAPKMDFARRYVERHFGKETAERIFFYNPFRILRDEYL